MNLPSTEQTAVSPYRRATMAEHIPEDSLDGSDTWRPSTIFQDARSYKVESVVDFPYIDTQHSPTWVMICSQVRPGYARKYEGEQVTFPSVKMYPFFGGIGVGHDVGRTTGKVSVFAGGSKSAPPSGRTCVRLSGMASVSEVPSPTPSQPKTVKSSERVRSSFVIFKFPFLELNSDRQNRSVN